MLLLNPENAFVSVAVRGVENTFKVTAVFLLASLLQKLSLILVIKAVFTKKRRSGVKIQVTNLIKEYV